MNTVALQHGAVLRLERRSGVRRVGVIAGVVWLTSAPAQGDVLLQGGESFELRDGWPYVVEALARATLWLEDG